MEVRKLVEDLAGMRKSVGALAIVGKVNGGTGESVKVGGSTSAE